MQKTLHKKLTEKSFHEYQPAIARLHNDILMNGVMQEMKMLQEAAKDLLQPRKEAVAKLLEMARSL